MARPTELRHRFTMPINFEYDEIKEFQAIVGKDNVSSELRAMVKNFLSKQKKGEAQIDPLNLFRLEEFDSIINYNNIQSTLDIYLSSKKEIREFIDKTDNVPVLAKIEDNARAILRLAHTKKINQSAVERVKREMNL